MSDQLGDEVSRVLPQLRIDELIDELQSRLSSVRSSRDRVRQLLEAVVGIGSGLDLETALTRIVEVHYPGIKQNLVRAALPSRLARVNTTLIWRKDISRHAARDAFIAHFEEQPDVAESVN